MTADGKDRLLGMREYRDGEPSEKSYQSSGMGDREFLRKLVDGTVGRKGGLKQGWSQFLLDGYTTGMGGTNRSKGHLFPWKILSQS